MKFFSFEPDVIWTMPLHKEWPVDIVMFSVGINRRIVFRNHFSNLNTDFLRSVLDMKIWTILVDHAHWESEESSIGNRCQ